MRLRSRPTARPGDDWVQARRAGSWTTVGNLDSPARAHVDPAGLVVIAGRTWSFDWWIGAEDRWHVPAREVAVRQALIGSSPVVETRLRVPSGDAVQRVYAARGPAGEDVVVVEVHNDTKVPFAVALAIRPYGLDGDGRAERVGLDGTRVTVDGEPALVLPRSPGRIALSTAVLGDAAAVVFAGDAAPVRAAEVRCPEGLAHGVLLFPLAHTAVLRVVMPLTVGDLVAPGDLPSADQVASGWGVHSRRAARFEVPNRVVREAVLASTRYLLLGDADDPRVAAGLDLMGFHDEARAGLTSDPSDLTRRERPGAALHALGQHWLLTRDIDAAKAVVPVVAALVPWLARAGTADDVAQGRASLPAIAALLEAAGEARAARDIRAIPASTVEPVVGDGAVEALLASASPTWTWSAGSIGHDLAVNAGLLTAVRRRLVQETADGLALTPVVPEAWLGQGWEVHDTPTAHGALSYAIRWHGERPALLWELDPHPGAAPARLTVPGLDPAWSSRHARGEALLAPVAVPERPRERRGLTIPVTIEPMPRRSP